MLKTNTFRNRFIHTAKEDFVCYKAMKLTRIPGIVVSPYQKYYYNLGEETFAELSTPLFTGRVASGLHAFFHYKDASSVAEHLTNYNHRKLVFHKIMSSMGLAHINFSTLMWEVLSLSHADEIEQMLREDSNYPRYEVFTCLVPKGAKFYKGVWDTDYQKQPFPNLAVNRLTILPNINTSK